MNSWEGGGLGTSEMDRDAEKKVQWWAALKHF